MEEGLARSRRVVQWSGLPAGPLLGLAVFALLPASYATPQGEIALPAAARSTAAAAVWMAVWWMTEAIPVFATALLPLVLFPLSGAATIRDAAAPYAHELIFLFMGGFIVALAMERWGLHRRIALAVLRRAGAAPRRIVAGFMAVTAALSMWISNTATAVMMLPIAISVIELMERSGGGGARPGPFSRALLLGIAYAASIGGIGTLVGTPPNLFLASFVERELGSEISFARWLGVGLPLVAVMLPATWWLLTRVLFPLSTSEIADGARAIHLAHGALGPMRRGEWLTLLVFAVMAFCWTFRPLLVDLGAAGLSDAGIAVAAALALFALPVDVRRREFVMDWETAVRLPWGVLVLFGGGLSLAAAIRANGLGEWLGYQVGGLASLPAPLVVAAVVTLVIFLTELTSNTATTATLLPVLAGIAPGLSLDARLLVVPAAMAASCAFMLPVATPPNAVVFGSGRVDVGDMLRAGFWLNLLGAVVITALTFGVAVPVLGIGGR